MMGCAETNLLSMCWLHAEDFFRRRFLKAAAIDGGVEGQIELMNLLDCDKTQEPLAADSRVVLTSEGWVMRSLFILFSGFKFFNLLIFNFILEK